MTALGMSSAVFGDKRPESSEWEVLAKHGFTEIELAAGARRFVPTDLKDAIAVRNETAAAGLKVFSISASLPDAEAAVTVAADIGAGLIVVRTGACRLYAGDPKLTLDAPAMLRSVESAAARADGSALKLAIEFPDRWPAAEVVRFLESLDVPSVGVCLDTGHAHMHEGAAEAIEQLSGYVHTIHLHDTGGRGDDHRLPFGGAIEWPTVLMELEKTGYRGPLVLEVAGDPDPVSAVARAVGARTRLQAILDDLAQPMVFPE